ncbi:hypothetical protein EV363DRAFT_1329079 [Boletus edulis]|uniref:NAD-binding protein n=1 Tax=Boletus edulis BED1 TaxID=1328754 RepID=A0AAD4BZQ5_BOLED|nr:hypothetical protein EV363DRAFT_1329079 [Boletus edulis]KAF8444086.1 hypothetical protein L210DRAFT_3533769 [Boletus edulis BED1]
MSIVKGIALITGSAQGVGRGIALRLARDGFDIALNDVASKCDRLRGVADDIEKIGRRTHLVPGDVAIEQEVKGMVQSTVQGLGGLDVMVTNAEVCKLSNLLSAELDDWERVMAVNARGTFLCYKYAAAQMITQGRGGRIIGASSIVGKLGNPLSAAYSASKFAVRGLTQTAAFILGRYKITVNSYAPGHIETPLTTGFVDKFSSIDKEMFQWTLAHVGRRPIKHDGQPEDVASIVSYLASKEAHFITGQCINVDGGIIMS